MRRGGNATKKRRSSSAADKIVAATAGSDTWKTYAGRNHGGDDFEVLDLFRGMKRSFHHTFLAGPPSTGTACPVCYCEPERGSDWHTTWCGHSVCVDCLQQYASSQVHDKEHSGPLKCPVCPQVLRRRDAIVALGGNTELIQQWDVKIRNQLLRALPAYRPCPKCSGKKSDSGEATMGMEGGGGFVTPECLRPHHDERRDAATHIMQGRAFVLIGLLFGYFTMISIMCRMPSKSPPTDLFFMLVLVYPFVKAGFVAQHWVAQVARRSFLKPITVECPCCNESFILPAMSRDLQDEESSRWMSANARACPSCSAKIVKHGGCNHMRCSNCRAEFCWACMQLRSRCQAFRCVNGARYGNATPDRPGEEGTRVPQDSESILTIIDAILERRKPALGYKDVILLGVCLFARSWDIVQYIVGLVMAALSSVIVSQIILGAVTISLLGNAWQDMVRNHRRRRNGVERQHWAPFQQQRAIEQAMVDAAIRRSIEEM